MRMLPLKRRLGTWASYAIPISLLLLFPHVPRGLEGPLLVLAVAAWVGRRVLEMMFWTWWAPYGYCEACGHAIPLVARWKCGCGYLPPDPRHAFGRCVLCGKGFRWVSCPSCDGSILI
jgi:hypothetical protein